MLQTSRCQNKNGRPYVCTHTVCVHPQAYLAAGAADGGLLLVASGSSRSILGSRGGMIGLVTLSRSTTAASCRQVRVQGSTYSWNWFERVPHTAQVQLALQTAHADTVVLVCASLIPYAVNKAEQAAVYACMAWQL
jgi:hypothetical protein